MAWGSKSRHDRGYDHRWVKTRAIVLKCDKQGRPRELCRPCLMGGRPTSATQCDHIVPKSKGGTDDLDNLQPICDDCHNLKTAVDEGRKIPRKIGLDGYPV